MRLRPFFWYYGAKWVTAPKYPAPIYDVIVEPFAGSAAYSLLWFDRAVLLIEKDPPIAALWRFLINVREEEILSLPDVVESVDELGSDVCEEAKILVGMWLGYSSHAPKRRRSAATGTWSSKVRERIASQLWAIRHWEVWEGSYEDAPDLRATWFVDPPYQVRGTHYRMSSKKIDYLLLAEYCHAMEGQVMVCENEGATWLPFEPYLVGRSLDNKRAYSLEALWYREE